MLSAQTACVQRERKRHGNSLQPIVAAEVLWQLLSWEERVIHFSFIAYALIALSLVTVDMGIVGRSLQQPISGAAGGGFSPHGGMYADSLLSPSHPRYRPGSLILAQLAANDSNSAENDRKDQDKLHRAAIALMVYLATDGIRR